MAYRAPATLTAGMGTNASLESLGALRGLRLAILGRGQTPHFPYYLKRRIASDPQNVPRYGQVGRGGPKNLRYTPLYTPPLPPFLYALLGFLVFVVAKPCTKVDVPTNKS
jgi:hypothetical protein